MHLFSRVKRKIASKFLTCPSTYMAIQQLSYDTLAAPENRFARADLLRALSSQLHTVLREADLPVKLVINSEGVFADVSGILLDTQLTDRYFKSPSGRNEAEDMARALERFSIAPKIILDIGANFGEISLYLAKEYAEAKVFSIEGSETNFSILKKNIENQSCSIKNIFPICAVLADCEKQATFSSGFGSESSLSEFSPYTGGNAVSVSTVPLSSIIKENNIGSVDFIKIDIEGAEPLLANDLSTLAPTAMYIEIGSKNTAQAYSTMLQTILEKNNYTLFFSDSITQEVSLTDVINRKLLDDSTLSSFDLWMIKAA